LDIVTLNVLENFLLDFPGCLLVVSHDRYFMDKIVDHLFVFRGDAVVDDFPGNYSDYRTYEDSKDVKQIEEPGKKQLQTTVLSAPTQKGSLSYKEKTEFANIESDIAKINKEKDSIEAEFSSGNVVGDAVNELSQKLQAIIQQIDDKEERWFELSAKLEGE